VSGSGSGAPDRVHATVAGQGGGGRHRLALLQAVGGSSCDRRAWRPWGAPPPATDDRGGRGGGLQLRPLAGVRLLGAVVMLTGRQANCSRVGAVGAPQLTRHQLTLPGGLLMMFKATRRESARIKKSWSVLSAPRTTTQTSVRNSAGQNRRWLFAVLQRMV
jgi:hypothetical protein